MSLSTESRVSRRWQSLLLIVFLRSRRALAQRPPQSREIIRFDVDGGSFRSGGARLNTLAVVAGTDDRSDSDK